VAPDFDNCIVASKVLLKDFLDMAPKIKQSSAKSAQAGRTKKATMKKADATKKKKSKKQEKTKSSSDNAKPPCISQGLQQIAGMTKEPFQLTSFIQEVWRCLKWSVSDSTSRKIRFGTACSGSGAPTLVLRAMVGNANVQELVSSEKNPAAAHSLLLNTQPEHCHADLFHQTRHPKAFCYCCNKLCPSPSASFDLDLMVAGFPCNPNSVMNKDRYAADATSAKDSDVFLATVSLIVKTQPKIYILENVNGVNMRRGGSGPEADQTVADWLIANLKEQLGPSYSQQMVSLQSFRLSLS
jgi:hypothetical protein